MHMSGIHFIDQAQQYRLLEKQLKEGIHNVLEQGQYILGPEVYQLEEALKNYTGADDVITVANGTDALTVALMAKGVEAGDVVFVPEFTYCATAGAAARLGAIVFFVDIDPLTYTVSVESLQHAIAQCHRDGLKMKGLISVDLFGLSADYDALTPVLAAHGLWLIQDAAQAFGAYYHDKRLGAVSELTTTSFYPSKILGCYGDGGAVFVKDNPVLAERIRRLRIHGVGTHRYDHIYIGFNSRLDTLQAAILLAKLGVFDDEVAARHRLAHIYNTQLDASYVRPYIPAYGGNVYAYYNILLPEGIDRDKWQAYVLSRGVPTMVYYPLLMSQQQAYAHFPTAIKHDSQSYAIAQRIVALPMHGYMQDAHAAHILQVCSDALHLKGF